MSEWIDVNDRLPEGKVFVLYGEPFFGGYTPEIECGYYDEDSKKWFFWLSDTEIRTNGVTHWQPLPEPPEQENER